MTPVVAYIETPGSSPCGCEFDAQSSDPKHVFRGCPDHDPQAEVCGVTYDHDEEIDYEGEDGVQWHCRRCDAEGWAER